MTPIVKAVQGAKDSIVNIHGQKTLSAGEDPSIRGDMPRRVNGMGTGVVIDERGYIITNYHVVDGVQKIEVTTDDGTNYTAKFVSRDPVADLAVIKIEAPKKLPVITIGTSSDLMVGETVIAVGNATAMRIRSPRDHQALHRSVQVNDTQGYDDLIQVDAAINPGNSGGPLLNIDGEMIGINVAVRAGAQGIGFAIPADKAMAVAAKLLSVERIDKLWHGIIVQDAAAAEPGVVVSAVDKESPAAEVGLKSGDVITAVGKQEVVRPLDIERALLGRKAGEAVPLTVRRNDQSVKLTLKLGELPDRAASEADLAWEVLGLRLSPIAPQQFKQLQSQSPKLAAYRGGMTITDVRSDSPASRQHLRAGDVLVGIHIWETIRNQNVTWMLNAPTWPRSSR